MNLNQVATDDLHYLLPRSLRDILEDKEPNFSSPKCCKNILKLDSNNVKNSPNLTPSPQIPPLESRLHTYLLKTTLPCDSAKPCNLSQFFNDVCINDEIQIALKDFPQRVKLFEYLENSAFFEQVTNSVCEFQRAAKNRLNAQATSFVPDANKENFCPKLKLSNRH